MTKATTTAIGPNTRINGRIVGDATVDVFGYVRGEIDLRDTLTVHEDGVVDGEVVVDNMIVNGTVRGQLRVRNHLVLGPSARVVATIHTHLFTVEEGARFSGEIETHIGSNESAKPLNYSSSNRRNNSRPASRLFGSSTATATRSSSVRSTEFTKTETRSAEPVVQEPSLNHENEVAQPLLAAQDVAPATHEHDHTTHDAEHVSPEEATLESATDIIEQHDASQPSETLEHVVSQEDAQDTAQTDDVSPTETSEQDTDAPEESKGHYIEETYYKPAERTVHSDYYSPASSSTVYVMEPDDEDDDDDDDFESLEEESSEASLDEDSDYDDDEDSLESDSDVEENDYEDSDAEDEESKKKKKKVATRSPKKNPGSRSVRSHLRRKKNRKK